MPGESGAAAGREAYRQDMNLPNRLTLARVVMTPVFVALLSFDCIVCHVLAYLLFVAATITDYYDGKIARERNLVTNFGKLLDPVADKVLLTAAFVMLMTLDGLCVPAWCVVAIIGREFLITGARSLAASEGVVIAANKWGKTKAVLQMVYVFVFLPMVVLEQLVAWWFPQATEIFRTVLRLSSFWAIVFVAVYTVYSGVQFARVNWNTLQLGKLS